MPHESELEDVGSVAGDARAISGAELAALFAPLARYARLLLAVSGGPDSLALLVLVAEWCDMARAAGLRVEAGGAASAVRVPEVHVATVDHGLRAQSALEAQVVAQHAERLGFSHTTLRVPEPLGPSRLAAEARAARYGLLARYARSIGAGAVVTAHHRDDQAETVLMRLLRGSGVDGLAGMRREQVMDWALQAEPAAINAAGDVDLILARPLIGVARGALVASLVARGIDAWADDPSNRDARFERARVRQALGVLEGLGLTAASLARLAERSGRASDALKRAADLWLASEPGIEAGFAGTGIVRLEQASFLAAEPETMLRVLGRGLGAAGGGVRSTLEQREDLLALLRRGWLGRRTLGGCEVSSSEDAIMLAREVGRMEARLLLAAGESGLWDGRCLLQRAKQAADGGEAALAGKGCEITAMTLETFQALKAAHAGQADLPVWREAAALPLAVFADGTRAAPTIGLAIGPDGRGLAIEATGLAARFVGLAGEATAGARDGP